MCLGIVSVSRETRSFVLRCIKVDSMFHVKHCGVGRFAGWLFGNVVSSLLVVGGWCFT